MVLVFSYILYYTKLGIFETLSAMLDTIVAGGTVDSTLITQTSREMDTASITILTGMVVFAALTGITAAHITLEPTRKEFALRKRFITAVAHELRTPLAVLRTSNEVALYDVSKNSPLRAVLEENVEQTKMIANILNNLIVFSRVGTPESLKFEKVDPSVPLRSVIAKLTPFAFCNQVKIIYTPADLPLIEGNATALEQAFYNLIKNAIIYKKNEGSMVTITATADLDSVSIVIADTGIGIPESDLEHVFEPFYRVHPDDSQWAQGSGLGLALVLEVVKLHKGDIIIRSSPGEGTIFTLWFPTELADTGSSAKRSRDPQTFSYSFSKK